MDGVGALIEQIKGVADEQVPVGAVLEGVIVQAGRGHLTAQVGRLQLNKADMMLNPYYSYGWIEDDGDATYLRAGDRVLFLVSGDASLCGAVWR